MSENKGMKGKRALSTGEVAKYCGVSPVSVFNWIRAGKIKAYSTPGGQYRVPREEFLAFLRSYKMPIPPEFEEARGKRILVVDDEPSIVSLVVRALSQEGSDYEFETAGGGYEACIKIGHYKPDLVILDLFMPDYDGFAVCGEIKRNPDTRGVRILAITAFPDPKNIDRVMEAGADGCMAKPLDLHALRQKTAELLGVKKSGT